MKQSVLSSLLIIVVSSVDSDLFGVEVADSLSRPVAFSFDFGSIVEEEISAPAEQTHDQTSQLFI